MVFSTTTILAVVSSAWVMQTITAAVTSMSKPKQDDGCYSYWYRFLHALVSALTKEKVTTVPPSGFVDTQTVNTVTTPTTQTQISTSKTTTALEQSVNPLG